MEELTEVITAVQFHPLHCNILAYSSSRGAIKVCDTRNSALCTTYAKVYSEPVTTATNKSFISDILNSISDVKYVAFLFSIIVVLICFLPIASLRTDAFW